MHIGVIAVIGALGLFLAGTGSAAEAGTKKEERLITITNAEARELDRRYYQSKHLVWMLEKRITEQRAYLRVSGDRIEEARAWFKAKVAFTTGIPQPALVEKIIDLDHNPLETIERNREAQVRAADILKRSEALLPEARNCARLLAAGNARVDKDRRLKTTVWNGLKEAMGELEQCLIVFDSIRHLPEHIGRDPAAERIAAEELAKWLIAERAGELERLRLMAIVGDKTVFGPPVTAPASLPVPARNPSEPPAAAAAVPFPAVAPDPTTALARRLEKAGLKEAEYRPLAQAVESSAGPGERSPIKTLAEVGNYLVLEVALTESRQYLADRFSLFTATEERIKVFQVYRADWSRIDLKMNDGRPVVLGSPTVCYLVFDTDLQDLRLEYELDRGRFMEITKLEVAQ